MEKREYTVYKFDELPEEVKEKVIEKYYDINIYPEWWQWAYEDAKNIGLKVTEFDLYHGTISGKLTMDIRESIKKIWEDHGKECEAYKTACQYWEELKNNHSRDEWDYQDINRQHT